MVATYTEGDEPVPGYRLIRLLGWGRFGEVWKASAPGGFEAAVKLISLSNQHGLKEFRAIRLFKQVRHPNLVPLTALWLKDKQGQFIDDDVVEDGATLLEQAAELIIAMGVGDKSLFDRLKECHEQHLPGVPVGELLEYLEQVGSALDYLNQPIHDMGQGLVSIQHCDIKPHNILLVSRAAQVCDLGVARILEDTRATAAMGSAAYVAPECITEGKPSCATDQYSLAISYAELRTGSLPIEAKSIAAAYLAHMHGKLDFSKLPRAEQLVLQRATAVNPKDRYPNIRTMVRDLRQAATEEEAPVAEAPAPAIAAVPEPVLPPPRELAKVAAEWSNIDSDADLPVPPPPRGNRPVSMPSLLLSSPEPVIAFPRKMPAAPKDARLRGARTRRVRMAWFTIALAILLPALVVPGHVLLSRQTEEQSVPAVTAVEPSEDSKADVGTKPPDLVKAPTEPPAPSVLPPMTGDAAAHLQRGVVYQDKGELIAAIGAFAEALKLDPNLIEAYTRRASAEIDLGQYEEAIADCSAALARTPSCLPALNSRARAHLRQGTWDQAITDATATIQSALQQAPRTAADAYFTRGSAYLQKQDAQRALADFDEASRLNRADTRIPYERTRAALAVQKPEQILSRYTDWIRREPKNAIAYMERGHVYFHNGSHDRALADCTEALKLAPAYVEGYCLRAEIARLRGHPEQAIADCTTALRHDPRSSMAYFFRGAAYLDVGNGYDQAIADFNRVLLLDPQWAEAYARRGEAYATRGQYERARADYNEARRLTTRKEESASQGQDRPE